MYAVTLHRYHIVMCVFVVAHVCSGVTIFTGKVWPYIACILYMHRHGYATLHIHYVHRTLRIKFKYIKLYAICKGLIHGNPTQIGR